MHLQSAIWPTSIFVLLTTLYPFMSAAQQHSVNRLDARSDGAQDYSMKEASMMLSNCMPFLPSRLRDQPDRGQVASPVKSSTFSSNPVVGQNIQSLPDVISTILFLTSFKENLSETYGRSDR